jgi:hypothetical protein
MSIAAGLARRLHGRTTTMRFMMLMYPGAKSETGYMPAPEAFEAMMKYNKELQKAGVLLALDGLQPTSKGARVRLQNGKKSLIDGPFTEAKEIVGGYWMIQVRSREEALEWAKRIPLENEAADAFVEVRQVFEMSDFPAEVQKVAGTLETELRRQ